MSKPVIIIPARYKSSRFPGKPLKKILNKPMILRVAEKCKNVVGLKNLIIATDNKKIKKVVEKNNYNCYLTPKNCKTGTDRVAFISKKIKSKFIINVQGDEPLIKSSDIKKVIKLKKRFPKYIICGYSIIKNKKEIEDKNVIKVVKNYKDELIYFSRSKIPANKKKKNQIKFFKQVCVYCFSPYQLKYFYKSKRGRLEKEEDVELLRFLELGFKIKMCKVSPTISVDVPTDIKKVENFLKKR